jgi:hypothetical protein
MQAISQHRAAFRNKKWSIFFCKTHPGPALLAADAAAEAADAAEAEALAAADAAPPCTDK